MFRLVWLAALIGAGCGSAVVESVPPSPTPKATPSPTSASTATASAIASAAGLRFPTAAEVPLEPGRYSSQPPFDIDFTFDIPADGWESGHLNTEFFDVLQLPSPGKPSRWIAFAHPSVIHGQTDAPATGLTPQQAIDRLATLEGLEVDSSAPFEIGGLTGVAAHLRATGQQVPLFGGENGDFGFDSELDLRLGIVPYQDALLLVLVMAPPEELEAAWTEAAPILESVEFAAP